MMMTLLEAMDVRCSRRCYSGALEGALLEEARRTVRDINTASGLSFTLVEDATEAFASVWKTGGLFSGVRSVLMAKGPAGDPHLLEKVGHEGERFVLEMTRLGLGTCWVGATFDDKTLPLTEGEQLVCVITVGPVPDERTAKEQMIRKVLREKGRPLESRYEVSGTAPDWFYRGLAAVGKAPSARNTQKASLAYRDGQATASIPDDYRFDLVDLGIAKLHFELAAGGQFEMGNGSVFVPD